MMEFEIANNTATGVIVADAGAKLAAGTHVLMPVKADADMAQAIENYFTSIQRHRKNPNSDAMKADCWCALMAYYAMVQAVRAR